jgi:hypothetical protein
MSRWNDESLRREFAALGARALPLPDCPDPERIFAAVRGELEATGVRALLDHVAGCGSCAEDWRLARELMESVPAAPARPARRPGGWAALPAAAAVVAAVSALLLGPNSSPYRDGNVVAIRSLLEESRPLTRRSLVLRWTPGPKGSRYDVLVATSALAPLFSARGLEVPELAVPEQALAGLPKGAKLLWRVEATLPEGVRAASATFVARID